MLNPTDFLLSDILADPADDAPRLALADWLDESDRPDDAAFLRAQLRLARRKELRLPRAEAADLEAESGDILRRHRIRWLGELALDAGWVIADEWSRGFVVGLTLTPTGPPASATAPAGLEAFPLLERLRFVGGPYRRDLFDALPVLPQLTSLRLTLNDDRADAAMVRRLSEFPRLADADIRHMVASGRPQGQSSTLLSTAQLSRVRELRAARVAADPIEAARSLGAEVRVTPVGVALDFSAYANGDRIIPPPGLVALSWAGGFPTRDAFPPAWVAGATGLRSLCLSYVGRIDTTPLMGLTKLRHVTIESPQLDETGWNTLTDWLASRPRLTSLALSGFASAGDQVRLDRLAGIPTLRAFVFASLTPGLTLDPGGLLEFNGRAALRTSTDCGTPRYFVGKIPPIQMGPPESLDGVTVRAPDWFRRVEPSPFAGECEPLAAWAEWGDGDPADRLAPLGPAWVQLERLPFPIAPADADRFLRGPAGSLDRPARWPSPARRAGAVEYRWMSGRCAFAWHLRCLWPGKRSALRLRAEWPIGRTSQLQAAVAALADTVTPAP